MSKEGVKIVTIRPRETLPQSPADEPVEPTLNVVLRDRLRVKYKKAIEMGRKRRVVERRNSPNGATLLVRRRI